MCDDLTLEPSASPLVAHRLRPDRACASPRRSPSLVNTISQLGPPPRRPRRPSGPEWPHPGNAVPPSASSAMTPSPHPVEPTVSSRAALRPRPGRALLAEMAATKVARLLHHGLVDQIAGRGWLCWCPGRLLRLLHALLRPGRWSIFHVNGQRSGETSTF